MKPDASYLKNVGILFALWLLLSGNIDPFHVSVGLATAAIAAGLRTAFIPAGSSRMSWRRLAAYLPWLWSRIFLATVHVSWLVLHPRMPIEPRLLRSRAKDRSASAKALYGNSITLTPGTITVDFDGDDLVVHQLDDDSAGDVVSGEMAARVAAVFGGKA